MNGRNPYPELVVRPVAESDVGALVSAFRSLSAQSFYRCFFTLTPDPTRFVVRHVERLDHVDHEALVVLDGDAVVATAQWDRTGPGSTEAEVAIVVVDAWQHRGLGTTLIRMLAADARRHGTETIVATVLTGNPAGVGLASAQRPTSHSVNGTETTFSYALAA